MEKVLVSACFMSNPVRYDGTDVNVAEKVSSAAQQILNEWDEQGRLVSICPEVSGGLPIPRPPAEIQVSDRVIDVTGKDVTTSFMLGARNALALCLANDIKLAVLTEGSPSCGSTQVYDGSFSNTKVPGRGITARLLEENGIRVFSQFTLEEAKEFLEVLEAD